MKKRKKPIPFSVSKPKLDTRDRLCVVHLDRLGGIIPSRRGGASNSRRWAERVGFLTGHTSTSQQQDTIAATDTRQNSSDRYKTESQQQIQNTTAATDTRHNRNSRHNTKTTSLKVVSQTLISVVSSSSSSNFQNRKTRTKTKAKQFKEPHNKN